MNTRKKRSACFPSFAEIRRQIAALGPYRPRGLIDVRLNALFTVDAEGKLNPGMPIPTSLASTSAS